jgi:hypothetical protein
MIIKLLNEQLPSIEPRFEAEVVKALGIWDMVTKQDYIAHRDNIQIFGWNRRHQYSIKHVGNQEMIL